MENDPNPYATPGSDVFAASSALAGESIADGVLNQLRGTKGWALLLGSMSFLFAGLCVLGGIGILSTSRMISSELGLGGMMLGMGIAYLVIGVVCIYPGIKLWKFGLKVNRLLNDPSTATLEAALNEQRILFKYAGIVVILGIVAFVLVLVKNASNALG